MDKITELMKKHFMIFFSVILLGSAVLYFMLAGGVYVWADEAYTFAMIHHSYKEIWKITAADVHPPLYYFVTKLLTSPFNYSLFSAKVVSILPYVFIIAFGGLQFRRLFNEKMALIFMCLFFAFPFSLPYAIEVRMYSLAAAFVFANSIYAYRCFKESNITNWVFFVFCGVGAAYTHYFALVSVGIVYGLLLIAILIKEKKLISNWLLASLLTVILYLPWLKIFIEQLAYKVTHEYWIRDITVRTLLSYVYDIFGADGMKTFVLFSSLTYLVALIYVVYKKKRIALCVCALLVPICTIGVGVAASLLVRPVFVIRYVIPAVPLLVTFMAISISEMKSELLVASMLTVALMGGISNYGARLHGEYSRRENELDESFVSQYSYCDGYIVLTETSHIPWVLGYYETKIPIYRGDIISAANPYNNRFPLSQFDESKNNVIVLLLDVGESPPTEYTSNFDCDYIGEKNENGHAFDAYVLSKRIRWSTKYEEDVINYTLL